jgi:repressor LexA
MAKVTEKSRIPLTMRQETVLQFIIKTISEKQRAPSLREIALHLGASSTNGISEHLEKLVAKGYIARDTLVARGISLTTPSEGSVRVDIARERIELCEIGRNGDADEVMAALEAVRTLRLSSRGRPGGDE